MTVWYPTSVTVTFGTFSTYEDGRHAFFALCALADDIFGE